MNKYFKLYSLMLLTIAACTNQIPYKSTIERPDNIVNIHQSLLREAYSQGYESTQVVNIQSLPPIYDLSTPIVRVAPSYPKEAFENKIEGWVTLIFTINTLGEPVSIKVLENSGNDVFDEVSINALKQFIYKPVVIDKKIVSVSGVKSKFNFALEK